MLDRSIARTFKKLSPFISLLLLIFFVTPSLGQQASDSQLRQEEEEDYFKNWLKRDVVYIITKDESAVFQSLTTNEEKERFIEQFWFRRDPDPRTSINEFKEEHYRRIAFVSERYGSGLPGWRTDRGKTYIIHGPPDEIDPHPSGGAYDRPFYEGGGQTATFPFEIWRYRHIEGLGSDIELEFVDRSYSGEYKLALEPEEKDAFLYIPNAGLTDIEMMGLATKAQRPYFDPTSDYPAYGRFRDEPFERFRLWNRIHHPPKLKYPELREVVEVDMSYGELPFDLRLDYFKLSEEQSLAAVTVELRNSDLTFTDEMGVVSAQVAVYGIVTAMSREIVTEFDDDLINRFTAAEFASRQTSHSLYQKILALEAGRRHMLTIVVKDLNTNRVGVEKQAMILPQFENERLTSSTLVLSDSFQIVDNVAMSDQMFVIGDLWIHPGVSKTFSSTRAIGAFFHIYNTALDQSTLSPNLQAKFEVFQDGKPVLRLVEHNNESLHYFSAGRTVFIKQLPVQRLEPGKYQLQIEIRDQLKDEVITLKDEFEIV